MSAEELASRAGSSEPTYSGDSTEPDPNLGPLGRDPVDDSEGEEAQPRPSTPRGADGKFRPGGYDPQDSPDPAERGEPQRSPAKPGAQTPAAKPSSTFEKWNGVLGDAQEQADADELSILEGLGAPPARPGLEAPHRAEPAAPQGASAPQVGAIEYEPPDEKTLAAMRERDPDLAEIIEGQSKTIKALQEGQRKADQKHQQSEQQRQQQAEIQHKKSLALEINGYMDALSDRMADRWGPSWAKATAEQRKARKADLQTAAIAQSRAYQQGRRMSEREAIEYAGELALRERPGTNNQAARESRIQQDARRQTMPTTQRGGSQVAPASREPLGEAASLIGAYKSRFKG